MTRLIEAPTTVELFGTYRGAGREVSSFSQEFGPFPTKRAAWDFIQSHGLTAADKGDKWIVWTA